MPTYLVKQPNDKFAMFSTITDDFEAMDMTEEEAHAECLDRWGRRVADEKVANAKSDAMASDMADLAPEGQRRWMGAMSTVRARHGEAVAERRLKYSFGEDE